jgi:hypothetical protein
MDSVSNCGQSAFVPLAKPLAMPQHILGFDGASQSQ